MTQKRLLFATLLLSFLTSAVLAQDGRINAIDAIQRGNQKFSQGEYKLAIKEYGRVSPDAGESYATSLYNTGVCYYELWQTDDAINYYRRAVAARQGRYPAALHALGVAFKDLKRLEESKESFEQAIRTSEGNYAPSHYLLGLLAMDEGDHPHAAASFRQAIGRFTTGFKDRIPAAHNNLGVALARMGRLIEARREFETALRMSEGKFDEATYNLKLCSSLLAIPQEALASLKTVGTPERSGK